MMRTREDVLTDLIITGVMTGDSSSFTLLYRLWNPVLARYAARLIQDSDAANDVMQESWVAISKGLARLQDSDKFKPWAYRIVSNKCRDWIRSEQSRRRLNKAEEIDSERLEAEQKSSDDSGAATETIRRSLRLLSEEQRIIITLFYLEEFSVRDISAALGLPSGTIKSRLYNARRTLKGVLENQNDE